MFCRLVYNNIHVGIVSYALESAQHLPTVYTRVSEFLGFILQHASEIHAVKALYRNFSKALKINEAKAQIFECYLCRRKFPIENLFSGKDQL
jgi:hypothetical protein